MASQGTLKALVALSTAGATGKLIAIFVAKERGRKNKIVSILRRLDHSVELARQEWPNLSNKEIEQYTRIGKPLHDRIFSGPGFHAPTLTWLSRILLEYVQCELWDRGSRKGGALDSVLRNVEDLHAAFRGPDEEGCRREAEEIFEGWLGTLEGEVRPTWYVEGEQCLHIR